LLNSKPSCFGIKNGTGGRQNLIINRFQGVAYVIGNVGMRVNPHATRR
jgi:hypothetical protein